MRESKPLERLGWTADRAPELAALVAETPDLQAARVVLEHNHLYRVRAADGEWLAEVAGRLKHRAEARTDLPAVGDWVAIRTGTAEARAVIHAVLRRRTAFSRRAAGDETVEQVVAANIDTVFLVSGLDHNFNPRRVERYLVLARQSGALPVIVLNKADLVADVAPALAAIAEVAPDIAVHAVSARDADGLGDLAPYLVPGRTVALLGSSGVGKSSIVNRLVGNEDLKTLEVRASDSRGRHASVHRQLIVLPSGALMIDTPGMRELQLWEGGAGLAETFADIEALGAGCRFRDCGHDTEPGCAVKAAVDAGDLNRWRYESFLKLRDERAEGARRQEERALLEAKRQSKVMGKALKAMQKDRGR